MVAFSIFIVHWIIQSFFPFYISYSEIRTKERRLPRDPHEKEKAACSHLLSYMERLLSSHAASDVTATQTSSTGAEADHLQVEGQDKNANLLLLEKFSCYLPKSPISPASEATIFERNLSCPPQNTSDAALTGTAQGEGWGSFSPHPTPYIFWVTWSIPLIVFTSAPSLDDKTLTRTLHLQDFWCISSHLGSPELTSACKFAFSKPPPPPPPLRTLSAIPVWFLRNSEALWATFEKFRYSTALYWLKAGF